MSTHTQTFNHLNHLGDEQKGERFVDDQVGLFLFRSHLLGSDLRITNYTGGNTSCKTIEIDPLTGEEVQAMWIKGFAKNKQTARVANEIYINAINVMRGAEAISECTSLP